ncbi:hypothetical protein SGFS_052920 [Streptomyces graminofaciens]|uniref:Orc1-like AAA ATPase domain-containing protein n=1 Tax=Streptomyces graminofaciens TaxID=68212 RepID=A0ABN5VKN4_9ACTN|nr:ATP-binding protein [Streptomyces graminofaciens]BBC33998.1 hypothetical protein SGFS_052920 [Streptomyces graminofaciens]
MIHNPPHNPFVEQVAGDYFVGREWQVQEFKSSLAGLEAGQPRHLYIAGLHGTGKTSYLQKLIDTSSTGSVLGVLATLDQATAYDQASTLVKSVAAEIDHKASTRLIEDWESPEGSTHFYLPRRDRLLSDDLRHDLKTLKEIAASSGLSKTVICIDEGHRIEGSALSALKNAMQHLNDYLVILSLLLIHEKGGAVEDGRAMLDRKAGEAQGDYGASRFFAKGIPLGPFETQTEAERCIRRRLQGNPIGFTDTVIALIASVSGRVPHEIIAIGSDVYDRTSREGHQRATKEIFLASFKNRFSHDYGKALEIRSQLSETARRAILTLLEMGRSTEVDALAARMYPDIPKDAQRTVAAGIKGELDRMCNSAFCSEIDGRYEIDHPVRRYALEIALELE